MNKKFLNSIFNLPSLLLLIILAIAAIFRLYRIQDYMTFLGDEGRDVLVAYNILHGHLTLLGPTSSVGGFFLGPIYYYFMAPFLWIFNYDPVGPSVMIALLSIATILLMYKIGMIFFSKKAALIAAALYAIAPIVLVYSRSSWNPNAMPFFSLLFIYLLFLAIKTRFKKYFFLAGICYGIILQLHYIELFLLPTAIIFIAVGNLVFSEVKNFKSHLLSVFKQYALLLVGFLLGFSPFIAFEVRHQFKNTQNIINFVLFSGNTSGGSNFMPRISEVLFQLFGNLVAYFPTVDHVKEYNQQLIFFWQIGVIFLALGSLVVLIYQLVTLYRKKNKLFLPLLLISLWFFFGVVLFGLYKKQIYIYYFEFLFPLPFLLVGNLLSTLMARKKIFTFLGFVIFILLIGINLIGNPFQYTPNRQLNQMRTIAKFVMIKTDVKPFNFAIITGGNSDHAYRYFFTLWGHPPVTIQNSQNDPERNTVTNQLFVVCESLPCKPLGNSLWEIAGFGRADIAGEWDLSVVKIYKLIHYTGK